MITLFAALTLFAAAPNPVVDDADVLEIMDETALASRLVRFESEKGVEIAVATFPRIPRGLSARSHSKQLLNQWSIGSRTRDRGVLIALYAEDREVYIQYTLATPHITDGAAQHIIDGSMLPRFKQGDLGGGLQAGVSEVSATVLGLRIGAGAKGRGRGRFRLDTDDLGFLIVMLAFGVFTIARIANGGVSFGPSYRRGGFWGSSHRSSWGRSSWGGSSWGRRSGGGGFRGRGAGGRW